MFLLRVLLRNQWAAALAVSIFRANLLVNVPATSDPSAWYAGATAFALTIAVVLTLWGAFTSSRDWAGAPGRPSHAQ
jgi:hypothetical protein